MIALKDKGVTNSDPPSVRITLTFAPNWVSLLASVSDLYADMLPVTPNTMFKSDKVVMALVLFVIWSIDCV